MKVRIRRVVVVAIALGCAFPVAAQRTFRGDVAGPSPLSYIQLTERADGRDRVAALIFVQVAPDSMEDSVRGVDLNAAADRECATARRNAQLERRSWAGGCPGAEYDGSGRLRILGREFIIPLRDSALVIVVRRAGGDRAEPSIVATAMVRDVSKAADPPARGDTILTLPWDSKREVHASLLRAPELTPIHRDLGMGMWFGGFGVYPIPTDNRATSSPVVTVGGGAGTIGLGSDVRGFWSASSNYTAEGRRPGTVRMRLDFVILWRGRPGWADRRPTLNDSAMAAILRFEAEMRKIEDGVIDGNRRYVNGITHGYAFSSGLSRLLVAGEAFDIGGRTRRSW